MEEEFVFKDYQIGEFAKRMGVSPHFLKYYEQTGILKPETRENGYRYYTLWDASTLLDCQRMKSMGFSIKERRKIVTDGTAADLEQMLLEHESSLAKHLQRDQLILNALQNLLVNLRLCQNKEWQICFSEPAWFLPHTMEQHFSDNESIYHQLESWIDAMPMVRSAQRLTLMPDGSWKPEWGFSVQAKDLDRLGLDAAPPVVQIPGGKVFVQYLHYEVRHENPMAQHQRQHAELLAHIQRLNLTPGPVIFKEIAAHTIKDGVRQVYCILRVPITEN